MAGKKKATVEEVKLPELKYQSVKQLKIGDAQKQLASKASLLLGYRHYQEHISANELREALRLLEIQPLDPKSVEAYKKEVASQERKRHRSSDMYGWSVRWRATPISAYKKPIPEFVLNKAVQIAEKCPKAEFTIEELQVERYQRIQRTLPDPFLVAKLGSESFFVEVWDEPLFENKL